MTDAAKKILDEAMALPTEERRRIGHALLESAEDEGDLSDEWKSEIAQRAQEIERGEVELVDADAVADELRERFG